MTLELRDLARRGTEVEERLWREVASPKPDRRAEAPLPQEARRLVALRGGRPVARVAYGAREGFARAPGRTGYVGWYAAAEEEGGVELLREAAERLFREGARRVVGPLDGSTWYRYRVTLPPDRELANGEPFLTEPLNPSGWIDQFASAGFRPLLEYETRRVTKPRRAEALLSRRELLLERGIRLRSLSLDDYPAELSRLHALSLKAFAANPFYTPIDLVEFSKLYGPLHDLTDPALVRLAEDAHGRLVGYVFAFEDPLSPRGISRIVLKTLAVSPELQGTGLGAVLVDEVHGEAASRGAQVLHALMQVDNASRSLSGRRESEQFRRYLLLERTMG